MFTIMEEAQKCYFVMTERVSLFELQQLKGWQLEYLSGVVLCNDK